VRQILPLSPFAPDAIRAMAPASRARVLASMPWLLELRDMVGTGRTVIGFDYEPHHEAAKAQSAQCPEGQEAPGIVKHQVLIGIDQFYFVVLLLLPFHT